MALTAANAQPNASPSTEGAAVVRPELIAPAGNWDCARAAVENGADAIYFGLERHNARLRADNFTLEGLPALMEWLHYRGVRGYACFNTLLFTHELEEAESCLRALIQAGVDAAIVQDVGIARLARRLSPDFPLHASTQMTITSAAGVQFARELGCQLVVLARECSLKEIERIQQELPARQAALPLEVFVHGALCVAYSGQCLTSESLGGRSANRGVCAQACRLPYQLIADGAVVPLGDRRYLLSPRDLAALELVPDLARAGVASFKIEGRLKTPEYVANITRLYREALDAACGPAPRPYDAEAHRYEMEMAFSRGLYTGWFGGVNNQALVHARFGTKRGAFIGEVLESRPGRVRVRLAGSVKPGDGVVFDAGRPDLREEGGRVYEVLPAGRGAAAREAWLTFGRGDVQTARVQPGHWVWKTSDPELERRWRQSFAGETPRFQQPVQVHASGRAGEPLRVEMRDPQGHTATALSQMPLVAAHHQPLTPQKLREQLGRLGGTPFRLGTLEYALEGEVILPASELNRLRRELVTALENQRRQPRRWTLHPGPHIKDGRWLQGLATPRQTIATPDQVEWIVLVRSLAQLESVLQRDVATLYCELDDPRQYAEAVRRVRAAGPTPAGHSRQIFVAPPRITKPGETWILRQVRDSGADGYLVRNYDHLEFFAGCRCIGDYSLNIANPLSAEYFLTHYPLERVTASYDLNVAQLLDLLRAAPPAWFEITLHHHMPMFHMEHCVFCAFLSSGTDFTNCGRPCEKHDVKLRDRVGAEHPLRADAGCRNTVYNARAQTGAEALPQLVQAGTRRFRLEFVHESPELVGRTLERYQQLERGEITAARLWQELRLLNELGVTRGPL
ncbi:MAG: U32 family peptidase [Verrucomicrobiae bacterium]|nr:U32 family peptidase [Verrucomicrobiae bacterium]